MAKLQDKLMNRVIEGELSLDSSEQEGIVNSTNVKKALNGQDINVNGITSKGIANTGNIGNTGDIASSGKITGGEIIENMSGYSFAMPSSQAVDVIYAGVCKNGNKITFVEFITLTLTEATDFVYLGDFTIPANVHDKLYPYSIGGIDNILENKSVQVFSSTTSVATRSAFFQKLVVGDKRVRYLIYTAGLTVNTPYVIRLESTFLLSENLASQE